MQVRYMTQRVAYVVLVLVGVETFRLVHAVEALLPLPTWLGDLFALVITLLIVQLVNMWFHRPAAIDVRYKG